jgi:hypothetical protein
VSAFSSIVRLAGRVISVLELDRRTVPSPFGGGGIDSGVASSLLRSLLVHATTACCGRSAGRRALATEDAQLTTAASVDMKCCPYALRCQETRAGSFQIESHRLECNVEAEA